MLFFSDDLRGYFVGESWASPSSWQLLVLTIDVDWFVNLHADGSLKDKEKYEHSNGETERLGNDVRFWYMVWDSFVEIKGDFDNLNQNAEQDKEFSNFERETCCDEVIEHKKDLERGYGEKNIRAESESERSQICEENQKVEEVDEYHKLFEMVSFK